MDIQDMSGGAPAERHNIQATTLPLGMPTPEEIDALIAKEMSRLSTAEREKALDDLHGIGGVEEEDPAFVISCLEELEDHLTKIKLDTAYALAEAISRQYISAKKFRMMFLRADRYEPKEAAERMIRFFELKKRLFGVQKMLKEITLDDLDDDDVATLKTGCAQVSPCNDMAGRPVAVFLQKLRKYKVPENAVCAFSFGKVLSYLNANATHRLALLTKNLCAVCVYEGSCGILCLNVHSGVSRCSEKWYIVDSLSFGF
jgi:hypothetical protein